MPYTPLLVKTHGKFPSALLQPSLSAPDQLVRPAHSAPERQAMEILMEKILHQLKTVIDPMIYGDTVENLMG